MMSYLVADIILSEISLVFLPFSLENNVSKHFASLLYFLCGYLCYLNVKWVHMVVNCYIVMSSHGLSLKWWPVHPCFPIWLCGFHIQIIFWHVYVLCMIYMYIVQFNFFVKWSSHYLIDQSMDELIRVIWQCSHCNKTPNSSIVDSTRYIYICPCC